MAIKVGKKYLFTFKPKWPDSLPLHASHSGQKVKVLSNNNELEGQMSYIIQAEDQWKGIAFTKELSELNR